jgi:glycosyltransferase involved in cell wall biosynthesis
MMKIGFSGFVMDGGRTGIATYIINLLKSLQRVDHKNQYEILLNRDEAHLIPIEAPNFHQKVFASWINQPVANIAWHNTILPMLAWKEKYDLIHIPSFRRIPLIKGCKMVTTVHDMAPLAFPGKYDALRLFYHREFLSRMVHRCERVIAVSHYTKADILKFTGFPEDKIDVIYSGIAKEFFQPIAKSVALEKLKVRYGLSAPFIVYVSRIEHPAKNHLNLMKAFEEFKKRHPSSTQLVFAGADWNGADAVKRYAADSKYKEEIKFLGFVPLEDLPLLYSGSDLMAFPSFYEGFGFPVLEAMACGCPVICSDTTSLKEIATGYAKMFDPSRPDQICVAIVEGLTTSEDKIEAAKKYAAGFDWDKTAREVLNVYQNT